MLAVVESQVALRRESLCREVPLYTREYMVAFIEYRENILYTQIIINIKKKKKKKKKKFHQLFLLVHT